MSVVLGDGTEAHAEPHQGGPINFCKEDGPSLRSCDRPGLRLKPRGDGVGVGHVPEHIPPDQTWWPFGICCYSQCYTSCKHTFVFLLELYYKFLNYPLSSALLRVHFLRGHFALLAKHDKELKSEAIAWLKKLTMVHRAEAIATNPAVMYARVILVASCSSYSATQVGKVFSLILSFSFLSFPYIPCPCLRLPATCGGLNHFYFK